MSDAIAATETGDDHGLPITARGVSDATKPTRTHLVGTIERANGKTGTRVEGMIVNGTVTAAIDVGETTMTVPLGATEIGIYSMTGRGGMDGIESVAGTVIGRRGDVMRRRRGRGNPRLI